MRRLLVGNRANSTFSGSELHTALQDLIAYVVTAAIDVTFVRLAIAQLHENTAFPDKRKSAIEISCAKRSQFSEFCFGICLKRVSEAIISDFDT